MLDRLSISEKGGNYDDGEGYRRGDGPEKLLAGVSALNAMDIHAYAQISDN